MGSSYILSKNSKGSRQNFFRQSLGFSQNRLDPPPPYPEFETPKIKLMFIFLSLSLLNEYFLVEKRATNVLSASLTKKVYLVLTLLSPSILAGSTPRTSRSYVKAKKIHNEYVSNWKCASSKLLSIFNYRKLLGAPFDEDGRARIK